jgi:hypothetical protein
MVNFQLSPALVVFVAVFDMSNLKRLAFSGKDPVWAEVRSFDEHE